MGENKQIKDSLFVDLFQNDVRYQTILKGR